MLCLLGSKVEERKQGWEVEVVVFGIQGLTEVRR